MSSTSIVATALYVCYIKAAVFRIMKKLKKEFIFFSVIAAQCPCWVVLLLLFGSR